MLSFWLSLGPEFVLYRLVYNWPGFSFIRVPSRFTLLTLLGLAVLAGAGFERMRARLAPGTRRLLAVVAAAVLVAEFFAARCSNKFTAEQVKIALDALRRQAACVIEARDNALKAIAAVERLSED